MARKPTGVGRGGARRGAGRPKGSRSKVYKPHLEKLMALGGGPLPRDVLLAVMRLHFRAKRWDAAERTAALAAPYVHPKLQATALTVRPSLAQQVFEMSDEELKDHVAELQKLGGFSLDDDEDLATAKPKGSA